MSEKFDQRKALMISQTFSEDFALWFFDQVPHIEKEFGVNNRQAIASMVHGCYGTTFAAAIGSGMNRELALLHALSCIDEMYKTLKKNDI